MARECKYLKVIANKEELRKFYDTLVMPLEKDWVYVMFMVARKKWSNCVSRSEEMLDFKIFRHNSFDRFYRALRRWEVPLDSYVDRNTGEPICQEAIGFYIDLTPKSTVRGLFRLLSDATVRLEEVLDNPSQIEWFRRCDRRLFSYIHKSNAIKKPYIIIDMDNANYMELWKFVEEVISKDRIYWITVTRGGYHIFIRRDSLGRWWAEAKEKLAKMSNVEILDHAQTPIVGTYQGGKPVTYISIREEYEEVSDEEIEYYEGLLSEMSSKECDRHG